MDRPNDPSKRTPRESMGLDPPGGGSSETLVLVEGVQRAQRRFDRRVVALLKNPIVLTLALLGLIALLWWAAQTNWAAVQRLPALIVWGVMLGSIIALGSIGLSLAYGVLRFANFCHGDLMTVGAYAAFALLALLRQSTPLAPFSFGWGFLVALLLAMPITGLVAIGIDRVIYRPHSHRLGSDAGKHHSLGEHWSLFSLRGIEICQFLPWRPDDCGGLCCLRIIGAAATEYTARSLLLRMGIPSRPALSHADHRSGGHWD